MAGARQQDTLECGPQHCPNVRMRPLWRRHSNRRRPHSICGRARCRCVHLVGTAAASRARAACAGSRAAAAGRRALCQAAQSPPAPARRPGRPAALAAPPSSAALGSLGLLPCSDMKYSNRPLHMYVKGIAMSAKIIAEWLALGISMPGIVAYSRTGMAARTALASACNQGDTDVRVEHRRYKARQ